MFSHNSNGLLMFYLIWLPLGCHHHPELQYAKSIFVILSEIFQLEFNIKLFLFFNQIVQMVFIISEESDRKEKVFLK